VPTCSADSRSIPACPLSEVRKVTHLMWVNPRLAILRKSITVATAVLRNVFDGMRVATLVMTLKVATSQFTTH